MARGRTPNSGPYIVSWNSYGSAALKEIELHLWTDVCSYMRGLLIDNAQNVSVRFV